MVLGAAFCRDNDVDQRVDHRISDAGEVLRAFGHRRFGRQISPQ